jgi:phosphate uptake regulator
MVMKRKIVQHGNTSLTISLPIQWAKRFDLKKGDELDIEEREKSLLISTEKAIKTERVVLDVSEFDERSLVWHLVSLHKSGFDEIKLIFKDHHQMSIIQKKMSSLLGYSIMEQRENYCVVRTISEALQQEFEPALRRTFLVTLSMAESTYDAFKAKNRDAFSSLMVMEETNNQLVSFCHRLLNKHGYQNYAKTTSIYTVVWILESIADNYRDMMKRVLSENLSFTYSPTFFSIFEHINTLLRNFYEMFYKLENDKVLKISQITEELFTEIMDFIPTATPSEQYVLYYLNTIRNLIGESIGAVLGLKI